MRRKEGRTDTKEGKEDITEGRREEGGKKSYNKGGKERTK
jgi:hypothetical protein